MCGRFTQRYTWNEVHTFLNVFGTPLNLRPRYNIAPTTTVDVVRLDHDGRRELVSMRWGLVPMWWQKALKSVPATFNARAEGIATKLMFRDALPCCRKSSPVSPSRTGPKSSTSQPTAPPERRRHPVSIIAPRIATRSSRRPDQKSGC